MMGLPVGTVAGAPPVGGGVHAIDGDGSSLCEQVPPGTLVQIDDLDWADIAREHRCSVCQLFMTGYGMGHI
jgi:hypothetical protein